MLMAKPHEFTSREELYSVKTPRPTRTWQPIPHNDFLMEVDNSISSAGLRITKERHAVSADEKMYFGILHVKPTRSLSDINIWTVPDGCELTIGVRNSHNKKLSAAIGVGSNVLVCSNLAFYAEVVLKRKHTSGILQDLPDLINNAMHQLQLGSEAQAEDFELFRKTSLLSPANNFIESSLEVTILNLYKMGILPSVALGPVYDEALAKYSKAVAEGEREPEFCSVWDLFNCCTSRWKKLSPVSIPQKTMKLHRFCKAICQGA